MRVKLGRFPLNVEMLCLLLKERGISTEVEVSAYKKNSEANIAVWIRSKEKKNRSRGDEGTQNHYNAIYCYQAKLKFSFQVMVSKYIVADSGLGKT